jgi:hypothetical protein
VAEKDGNNKMKYPKIQQFSADYYILLEDFEIGVPSGERLIIRKDFIFDGASIPKLFKSIIGGSFEGKYTTPALVHDACYAAELFDRSKCDWNFLCMMEIATVSWWKRNLMWAAVKIAGGSVWDDHTETTINNAQKLVIIKKDI